MLEYALKHLLAIIVAFTFIILSIFLIKISYKIKLFHMLA
ncbi:Uncharacterised protein [Listeria fleischmannii subsp. fleischmannii]|uniref:Uncharacterized protein n=1 Tax=Listeria fleischmannii subsp. fleischmannii TaxID=1671902 RepID=A0A2X3GRK0_9LIST|nr:Uncharacterised protein [Listeria fleischmannii subsp. fleischmannii]